MSTFFEDRVEVKVVTQRIEVDHAGNVTVVEAGPVGPRGLSADDEGVSPGHEHPPPPLSIVLSGSHNATPGDIVYSFGRPVELPDASECEGKEVLIVAANAGGPRTDVLITPISGQSISIAFPWFTLEDNVGGFPNWASFKAVEVPSGFGGGWTWVATHTGGPQFVKLNIDAAVLPLASSWKKPLSNSRLLNQSFHETWPVDARCFRFKGVQPGDGGTSSYICPEGWGNLPNGLDIRLDLILRPPNDYQMAGGTSAFMELITFQDTITPMTGGDRAEAAFLIVGSSHVSMLSDLLGFEVKIGDIILFWEHVAIGKVGETNYHADAGIQYHVRMKLRIVSDTNAGEVRFYRGVIANEVSTDDHDITTKGQHRHWRLVGKQTHEDASSIVPLAGWPVELGLRFKGDLFWAEIYHGPDGDLVDDIRPTDGEPGDTSFVSTGGRNWVRYGNHIDIVEPPTYVEVGSPFLLPSPVGLPNGKTVKVVDELWVPADDELGYSLPEFSNYYNGDVFSQPGPFGTFSTYVSTLAEAAFTAVFLPAGDYEEIFIYCTVAGNVTVRLCLDSVGGNGLPEELLVDAGTVNTAGAAGFKTALMEWTNSTDRWVWGRVQTEAVVSATTVTTLNGQAGNQWPPWPTLPSSANAGRSICGGRVLGHALGPNTQPLDSPTPTFILNSPGSPRIWVRRAA